MSAVPELHEATFIWPYTEGVHSVIVTGDFDQWSSSVHLARADSGFAGTAKIPWGQRTAYKFVVDGRWTTSGDAPTETDHSGNVNNIYMAPLTPGQAALEPLTEVPAVPVVPDQVSATVAAVVAPVVAALPSSTTVTETVKALPAQAQAAASAVVDQTQEPLTDAQAILEPLTQVPAAAHIPPQVAAAVAPVVATLPDSIAGTATPAPLTAGQAALDPLAETPAPPAIPAQVTAALPSSVTVTETVQALPSQAQAVAVAVIGKVKGLAPAPETIDAVSSQAQAAVVSAVEKSKGITPAPETIQATVVAAVEKAKEIAPSTQVVSDATNKALDVTEEPLLPTILNPAPTDFVDTIAARHGTEDTKSGETTFASVASEGLVYVASGLGVVISNVVGVDPINPTQTAVVDDKEATPKQTIDTPAPKAAPAGPVGSIVPISIIPVNDASNNDIEPAAATVAEEEKPTVEEFAIQPSANGTKEDVKPTVAEAVAPFAIGPSTTAKAHSTPAASRETSTHAAASPVTETIAAAIPTSESTSKFVESESMATTPVLETGTNGTNGTNGALPKLPEAKTSTPAISTPLAPLVAAAPSTPSKKQAFPSSSTDSPKSITTNGDSPSSSKFGTASSTRSKRKSIFGKISHIFHKDGDKKEKEKK